MQASIHTSNRHSNLSLTSFTGFKIFFLFGFAYFLSYAFRAVNAVIAPDLIADLGMSNSVLGLLSSAYFVGFALMQLPLGVWLDKYGSRKTESVLLIFGVLGSLLFAWAENVLWVATGRGFIGIGVSACLMASFTAYRQWFKPEQQGSLASGMLVFGTAGALMTTIPTQALLPFVGWRGVFYIMAILVAIAAIGIRFGLPKTADPEVVVKSAQISSEKKSFLSGYGAIFKNGFFLQMLPIGMFNQGGFIAIQTLWLGPWLKYVVGQSDSQVAMTLFIYNLILLSGYLVNTWLVPRVNKKGISTFTYSAVISGIALATEVIAVLTPGPNAIYWWYFFGLCATSFILGQSLVQTNFPKSITGRVNTAYNLMLFVGAFIVQWGIGWMIDFLMSFNIEKALAFTYAMLMLLAIQTLSYIWMWLAPKILKPDVFVFKEAD